MVDKTRSIVGVKYLKLHNPKELKKKSLEDNVYFTLRDIFLNYGYLDNVFKANDFNSKLTNKISYEDRTTKFVYTNLLMDKNFLSSLIEWMKTIDDSEFDISEQYKKDCDTTSLKEYFDELDLMN